MPHCAGGVEGDVEGDVEDGEVGVSGGGEWKRWHS